MPTAVRTEQVYGLDVDVVTLLNGHCRAVLTNFGARLTELHVPDRHGTVADIVLQRPTLADLSTDDTYMGSTAGRFANRIRAGRLLIDAQPVQLPLNEGGNHLHGGVRGFDRRLWQTQLPEAELGTDRAEVTFWRVSPDGEEGYPGSMTTHVTFRLEQSALCIDILATTDAATVVNLVNHSYFNLGGHDSGTILDHLVKLRSSFYTPVDDELLPTGEVLSVAGTPYDFRSSTAIGQRIAEVDNAGAGRVAGAAGVGYDHNWVLEGVGMREVLTVTDPASGRRLTLSTNQAGVQLYTGGYLEGVTGKAPVVTYPAYAGFTLETQTFPDAVNYAHFPQAELRPGETYLNSMRFDFSTT